jgi:hypothetical protein
MAEASEHKSKRVRSPAYPNFDLRAAINHTQTIYDHEKRNAAPVAVVAKHCGYDITSSAGLRLVAALKQFGLVSEQGTGDDRHVQITDRALDILLADGEEAPERLKAIKTAALAPKIHRRLWDFYEGNLPSDQTLRAYLIRKMEFNDSTVGKFIKQFRSTIAFANLTKSDTIAPAEKGSQDPKTSKKDTPPFGDLFAGMLGRDGAKPGAQMRDLPVTLPSLNIAILRLPAQMTELDFNTLVNSLNAWKPALVAKGEAHQLTEEEERFGPDDPDDDLGED